MSKALSRSLAVVLCLSFCTLLSTVSFAQKAHSAAGAQTGETRTGIWRGRLVTYQVINGRNTYQGDIILDNVQPVTASGPGGVKPDSIGIAYPQYMWPKVGGVAHIPYTIDPGNGTTQVDNINAAITAYNSAFSGVIQFVPHVMGDPNWVNIFLDPGDQTGVCEADEGDEVTDVNFTPPQQVSGSGSCTVATILHEFGHVTGVWHEQSRPDRNTYVTVYYNNVIKGSWGNFEQVYDDAQTLTPYDYASVMEYPAFSFSRNGGPVIDSIPPGIPLSNLNDYSAADIEGIERLYGAPPTQITVTSNPPGLSVIVDGSTVTTPQMFTWALNSTHTLNVPTGVQTIAGNIVDSDPPQPTTFYYTYGRWNDNTAASHTITVTPGNGDLPFPATSPQVSTYSANFIQLVPFTYTSSPSGSGTVAATGVPSGPLSYTGVSGVYFVARQQATLTATPTSGYNFYDFNNGPYWLPGGLGANPKTFYAPDTGLTVDPVTDFTTYPVYHVDVTPDAFSSNLYVYVDDTFYYVPKNFSPDPLFDPSWTSNSTHTLDFAFSPQYPYSSNSRYAFSSWNAGTPDPETPTATDVTLPATPPAVTNYIATITPQFAPADNFGGLGPCGGTATLTPTSGDGFYNSGTPLTFTATPTTSPEIWTFAGWTYDITGTASSAHLSPTDESLVYANFNTTNGPLTLTSISPSTAVSGGPSFIMTLTGTGFTNPGSNVGINFPNTFLTPTSITSTQIQMTIPASAIASPGALQIFVENYPPGWSGCANFGFQTFLVSQAAGTVVVTATPASETFASQTVGTTSAGKTVTVKNTGTTSTPLTIAPATGDFAQTNNCPTTLGPSPASCTITVTFTPTATGTRIGSISITDNASNSPQMASLTGTGKAATVVITVTPATLTFASQAVGTTSPSKTVTVKNTGTGSTPLTIGAATGDFAQTNNCPTTLGPSPASCTITVTFSPLSAGSLTGSISITDSASNSPQSITLNGTGTSSSATLTFTPTSETFTSTAVGSTSAGKVITLKNTGGGTATLSSITASGDFGRTTTCGGTLNGGGTCTITVTFTPTVTGSISGAITVVANTTKSPQVASLTGTGIAPLTFSPVSLAFGSVAVGVTSAPKTVTVTNNQSTTLNFSLASSANYSTAGAGTTCGTSLAGGAKCTLSVTFTPTAPASIDGATTFAYTGAYSPVEVKFTGKGTGGTTAPLKFTPVSLSFAKQATGTTSAGKTVTVKNQSASSVTISSIAASGNFAAAGSGGTPCGGALAANASCTISVTFSPSISGAIEGAAVISDNASSENQQVVNLTGTAVLPVTIAPTSLTFASTTVGSTSAAQTLTITNNLTTTLSSLTFTASGDFSVTAGGGTPCGGSIAAGGTCTLSVTFKPSATGSIKGAVTVTDSASTSPQTVKLTGTGS